MTTTKRRLAAAQRAARQAHAAAEQATLEIAAAALAERIVNRQLWSAVRERGA